MVIAPGGTAADREREAHRPPCLPVPRIALSDFPIKRGEFHISLNGYSGFLARATERARLIVRHETNTTSGANVTGLDISAFLSGRRRNPEH
jgi:hypothetical protein